MPLCDAPIYSTGRRTRTLDFRFWRPTLYQLSYTDVSKWTLVDSNHILRIFSPAHTPCLPSVHLAEAERFELSELFDRLGPLAESWFRQLTHASFLLPHIGSFYWYSASSSRLTLQSYKARMQPICVPQNFFTFLEIFSETAIIL